MPVVPPGMSWGSPIDPERLPADQVIHASTAEQVGQQRVLCEIDGPVVSDLNAIALVLDSPDAPMYRDRVNCPGCLAWMHA